MANYNITFVLLRSTKLNYAEIIFFVVQADIMLKQCFPIYWSNAGTDSLKPEGDALVRGSWFFEMTWQPLDELLAERIEKEHLERWKGIDLKEIMVKLKCNRDKFVF